MERHTVIQFLPPRRPELMCRVIPLIWKAGARVCLDVEDGVQDPLAPSRNGALRAAAREHLDLFCRRRGRLPTYGPLGVRINCPGTDDFLADVEMLERLKDQVSWFAIFLPKVEASEQIHEFCSLLRRRGVQFAEVVPTIETTDGVENLEEILSGCEKSPICRVQFGHYDYNLDAGHWPFLDQRSAAFWELVSSLVNCIERRGLDYSHTPYGELNDDRTLHRILARLSRLCRREFSMVTLSLRQSRTCGVAKGVESEEGLVVGEGMTESEAARLAHRTIRSFRDQRCHGRSFSVVRKSGHFIAPHEYWAAIRFLSAREGAIV